MRKRLVCVVCVAMFCLALIFAGCSECPYCKDVNDFPKHGNDISISRVMFDAISHDWSYCDAAVWKNPVATCKTFISNKEKIENLYLKLSSYNSDTYEKVSDKTSAELMEFAQGKDCIMVLLKVKAITVGADVDSYGKSSYDFLIVYYVCSDGTVYKDDGFDMDTYKLSNGTDVYNELLAMAR